MTADAASRGLALAVRPQRLTVRTAAAAVLALGGPAAVTALAFGHPHGAAPALLYVLAVVAASSIGGRPAGLLAALASIVPFYYFFVPPLHTWTLKGDGVFALVAFVGTALLGGEAVARQRGARREAEQALETAGRLQRVADALASARTPQEVLDAVLTEGVRAAEARGGLIATLSGDGEWLEVLASRGYDMRYIEPFGRFPVSGDFPLSEAVRTGEGVFLGSAAERDARYPELVGRSQPGHALVCVPLVGERGPIGGLVFSFPADQQFPPDRRALKAALARQAALALERVRLSGAEQALRERLSFVGEASAVLTRSLDLERTLQTLADLAVPLLADWCAIDMLVEETGEILPLVVAHQDPERQRWAAQLRSRTATTIEDGYDGTAQVIRSGEPQFMAELPQELIDAAAARDPEAAKALEEISIRGWICVPLTVGGRTLGALSLVAEERTFTEDDFELAKDLAARAAVGIQNAHLYREAERRADAAVALAYVGDGVVLLDRDDRVRFWNAAAAAITGVPEDAALGRPVRDVLPAWDALTGQAELADAQAPQGARPVTVPFERPDGDRWVAVAGVAFPEGVVYALRDTTDEHALERARSDFVATASHELRTPLAAVYGAARTLRRSDIEIPPEQRDRFLEIIESETERLTAIVSQILLAGQLEEGRVDVAPSATDVGAVAASVLESARVRLPERIELRLEQNGGPTVALADEDKLRQVLVNLLDNAVKYSPDGGEVTVELGAEGDRVRVAVRDRGLGIPASEHDRIFEKFYRLDPGLTRGVGGSGLGLYISRELVSRMGGTLAVRSRPGEGATFVVELPGI